jgi:TRAP-type uncharacterized transport system substrate-binding protein
VVIVKADSPYKTLDDLKGKAFGFADPDSTSGYLIPLPFKSSSVLYGESALTITTEW